MNNNEHFGRLSLRLVAFMGGSEGDSDTVWGATLYMDMRILMVFEHMRKKRKLTVRRVEKLSAIYEDFLECMVDDVGKYQVYGSTYSLMRSVENVRINFLTEIEALKIRARNRSWFTILWDQLRNIFSLCFASFEENDVKAIEYGPNKSIAQSCLRF